MRISLIASILLLANIGLFSQIDVNTNFNIISPQPIDTRDTLTNLSDTASVSAGQLFPGLLTYAADVNQWWFWNGTYWERIVTDAISTAAPDTVRFLVYAPSHGLTDTIATYGYVPIHSDYTRANSISLDSTHFAYAVDAPHIDTLELKFSGTITVSGHGLTVGRLYYLQDSGPDGTTPGTVRAPTVYVLDANTLVLTEVGADQDQVISRQAVPSPVFTFWGGDPQNPSDSIMQIVVDSVFKPAGLAKPSTIFFMSYSSQSKNPTYQDDSPTDSPLNPSHSWFYDGNVVTRMNHLLTSVDLEATSAGLFTLTPITVVGSVPTDLEVANWLDTNYINNELRLPNGAVVYWKGSGTPQSPDYSWMVIDDITNTGESDDSKRILKRIANKVNTLTAPVFIQAFDRNTQLPACANSATVAVGFYLIDDAPINAEDVVFNINASPATITYDYYSQDSTVYYFESAGVTPAGSYFWEVDYFDDDGNVIEDANSYTVTAGRPDTVTTMIQDSILVTRVCGTEVSRDTISVAGTGGVSDGDKGDIDVTASGATWTIDTGVVTTLKIANDAVTAAKIATGAVGADELASTAVTPGSYTYSSFTVDADGRITAASSGTAPISGTGTTNYLPKFSSSTSLSNSILRESSGTIISAGSFRVGENRNAEFSMNNEGGFLFAEGNLYYNTNLSYAAGYKVDSTGYGGLIGISKNAGNVAISTTRSSVAAGGTTYLEPVWQYGNASNTHTFYADSIPKVVIDGAGDVGIGVSNPIAKIDVQTPNASVSGTPAFTMRMAGGNNESPGFVVERTDASKFLSLWTGSGGAILGFTDNHTRLAIGSYPYASRYSLAFPTTEVMSLLPAGNVGIGVTSPSYKLDIGGTGAIRIPLGTTAQRPTGADAVIRYNSTNAVYEGYSATGWRSFLTTSLSAGKFTSTAIPFSDANGRLTEDAASFTFDAANDRLGLVDVTPDVTLDMSGATDGITIPTGTTAQRGAAEQGQFRLNNTLHVPEIYDTGWYQFVMTGTDRALGDDINGTWADTDRGAIVQVSDATDNSTLVTYTLDGTPDDQVEVIIECKTGSVIDADDGCRIVGNGNNIQGSASYDFTTANTTITLRYSSVLGEWKIIN